MLFILEVSQHGFIDDCRCTATPCVCVCVCVCVCLGVNKLLAHSTPASTGEVTGQAKPDKRTIGRVHTHDHAQGQVLENHIIVLGLQIHPGASTLS